MADLLDQGSKWPRPTTGTSPHYNLSWSAAYLITFSISISTVSPIWKYHECTVSNQYVTNVTLQCDCLPKLISPNLNVTIQLISDYREQLCLSGWKIWGKPNRDRVP